MEPLILLRQTMLLMAKKKRQMDLEAPFGIVGLETAFPLLYTHLVQKNVLNLHELIDRMTKKPADVFGLPYGTMKEGAPADLTIVDLEKNS